MSKVIFTISYDIIPEKREAYLALMKEMHKHLADEKGKNYSVYEQKGKPNSFVEVFLCNSMEEYDALEDNQDEKTDAFVEQLEEFLHEGKMKYMTLVEVPE